MKWLVRLSRPVEIELTANLYYQPLTSAVNLSSLRLTFSWFAENISRVRTPSVTGSFPLSIVFLQVKALIPTTVPYAGSPVPGRITQASKNREQGKKKTKVFCV
ncbi:hypothetical protein KFK09_005840 [Dendrobium nobile]|uniref:Uncharacterized protein n=1 Tax=Dendrobium nobile TaxID=94219 RepID=A0A8T3C275_DENNO|nr:hypothetical protein KFK09_005840 [Dendrobium nobile]